MRVGIYLGQFPQHARSVVLVLNQKAALVSPQFYVTFDPYFHTCKQDKLEPKCQIKSVFVTQKVSRTEENCEDINPSGFKDQRQKV